MLHSDETAFIAVSIAVGLFAAVLLYVEGRLAARRAARLRPSGLSPQHESGCVTAVSRGLGLRPIVPFQRPRAIAPETVH